MVDVYRSDAKNDYWTIFSSSNYPRNGCNLLNFFVSPVDLRLWIMRELARPNVCTPEQDVYRYNWVSINRSGRLFLGDGKELSISKIDQTEESFPDETAVTISGTVAYIFKAGMDNYGHVLIEMLPKLILLNRYAQGRQIDILIPDLEFEIRNLVDLILQEFFPSINPIYCQLPVVVESLIVPGPVSKHNNEKSTTVRKFIDDIRCRFGSQENFRKIYVSREHIRKRKMVNEIELIALLKKHGFEIITPETMSFREQVEVFSSANIVIGAIGAGLTNTVFCNPGSHVVMIDPGTYDFFFYDLAALVGVNFTWYFTKEIVFKDISILQDDFSLDLGLFYQEMKFVGILS